jgi:hypothetical protein
VETLEMYSPKPSWDIAIVMIPPHPNDPLAVRDLLDNVQDPLVRLFQFFVRVVDDVAIKDKFMIFRNISQKALKVLI